jgi:hypothetical protein
LPEEKMQADLGQRVAERMGALQRIVPWFIVLLLAAMGYRSMLPPSPLPTTAPEEQFSAERAIEHVTTIAREPHPMGSPAIAEVRAYILAELDELGIETQLQTVDAPDYFGGDETVDVVNIIARIPGTATSKAIALMGHYDTVPTTPGGNDNTTAVAALLETGPALLAGPPLRNDVLLLFTDGEEPAPQFGATAFVERNSTFRDLGLVVNLEATGGSGASLLAETSGPEGWLVSELAAVDPHPAAFSFLTEITRRLGEFGSDFDAFRNGGVTGMHFVYLHGSPIYHTDADNIDAVNRGSLQHHGSHALGIARHFGMIDIGNPPPVGDAVFFTIRPFFFLYSTGWALPLAVLVVVCFSVAVVRRFRSSASTPAGMLQAVGRLVAAGLLAIVLGTLVWLVIVAGRSTPGILESYGYLLAVLAGAAILSGRLATVGRAIAAQSGIVLLWSALTLLTAVALPGLSYLFAWPALAAAGALMWNPRGSVVQDNLRLALVAAPTLLLTIPAVDVFFLMAQPRPGNPDSEIPSAIGGAILVALLAAGLVWTAWPAAWSGLPGRRHEAETDLPNP